MATAQIDQTPKNATAVPTQRERMALTYPTRAYAVSRNPFTVSAVLPAVVLSFVALEVALVLNAVPGLDVTVFGRLTNPAIMVFAIVTLGTLLVPAVALKGSLTMSPDGVSFERGKDQVVAGWGDIKGLVYNPICGLCLHVVAAAQSRPKISLPGGFIAQDGDACIPLRMFGDRQFSIIYDIRDRVPEASWRPAVERAGSRSTTSNLLIFGGAVAVAAIAMIIAAAYA